LRVLDFAETTVYGPTALVVWLVQLGQLLPKTTSFRGRPRVSMRSMNRGEASDGSSPFAKRDIGLTLHVGHLAPAVFRPERAELRRRPSTHDPVDGTTRHEGYVRQRTHNRVEGGGILPTDVP
jgi:hypothetical protein